MCDCITAMNHVWCCHCLTSTLMTTVIIGNYDLMLDAGVLYNVITLGCCGVLGRGAGIYSWIINSPITLEIATFIQEKVKPLATTHMPRLRKGVMIAV